MTCRVQCVACDLVLAYDHEDTGTLVEHLQACHVRMDHRRRSEQNIEESPLRRDTDDAIGSTAAVIVKAVGSGDIRQDVFVKTDAEESTAERSSSPAPISSVSLSSSEEDFDSVSSKDSFHQKLISEAPRGRSKRRTIYERTYHPGRPLSCYRGVSYKAMVESWRPGRSRITCPMCAKTRVPVIRTHREQETESSTWATVLLCCGSLFCLPWCFPGPRQEFMHCSVCDAFLATYDHDQDQLHPNFELFEYG